MRLLGKLGKSKSSESEQSSSKKKHGAAKLKAFLTSKGKRKGKSNSSDRTDDSHEVWQVPSAMQSNGHDGTPSMDKVPLYISDLSTATDTADAASTRAIRHLFALSEHSHESCEANRLQMIHGEESRELLPVLLQFLQRCDSGSQEQYLVLLVLNNLSIPAENKRLIALEFGGVHLLARLLCEDPSCHLLVIILVNLTFAESDLRREMVSNKSSIQLIDALAFALQVSLILMDPLNCFLRHNRLP